MKNEKTPDSYGDINKGESNATFCDLLEVIIKRGLSKPAELPDLWPIIEILRGTDEGGEIELSHKQWSLVAEKFNHEDARWPVLESFCRLAIALQEEMGD